MRIFARLKKIHDQYCTSMPYNYNIANAMQGFHEMGFEIITYYSVNEIYDDFEFGDILLDGIDQVNYVLKKFDIETNNIDYPEVLNKYLGRKIWTDKINHINSHPELWPVFVKPVEDKKFTGVLIKEPKDLIGCGSYFENADILCSEPVDFIYECRGFVYYDKLIDLRPYKGDFKDMNKINTQVIENAIKDFTTWKERPSACSLDFGVTKEGKTLFIEMNSAYALGCYGLFHIQYAKLISACFSDYYKNKDECKF